MDTDSVYSHVQRQRHSLKRNDEEVPSVTDEVGQGPQIPSWNSSNIAFEESMMDSESTNVYHNVQRVRPSPNSSRNVSRKINEVPSKTKEEQREDSIEGKDIKTRGSKYLSHLTFCLPKIEYLALIHSDID